MHNAPDVTDRGPDRLANPALSDKHLAKAPAYSHLAMVMNARLDKATVLALTSLSGSQLARKRAEGRFPEPERISQGRVAWRAHVVKNYLDYPDLWEAGKGAEALKKAGLE